MSKELECPECESFNDVPDDCYEPNTHYTCECNECGNIFGFTLEYYPSYIEYKTPCENGEPHDWKPIRGWPSEYYENRRRCSYCGEESTVDRISKMEAVK